MQATQSLPALPSLILPRIHGNSLRHKVPYPDQHGDAPLLPDLEKPGSWKCSGLSRLILYAVALLILAGYVLLAPTANGQPAGAWEEGATSASSGERMPNWMATNRTEVDRPSVPIERSRRGRNDRDVLRKSAPLDTVAVLACNADGFAASLDHQTDIPKDCPSGCFPIPNMRCWCPDGVRPSG